MWRRLFCQQICVSSNENTIKRYIHTIATLRDITYLSTFNMSAKLEDFWLEKSIMGLNSSSKREHKYTKSDHVGPCIIVPVQLRTIEWNLQQTQQATAENHWLQTWTVVIKSDSLWLLKKIQKSRRICTAWQSKLIAYNTTEYLK